MLCELGYGLTNKLEGRLLIRYEGRMAFDINFMNPHYRRIV
jgi:hypothetical protein